LLAAAQTIFGKVKAASEFPSAYCRNKSMPVASCIHLSMAADGKKRQPILNQYKDTKAERFDTT
jgi:hypothetical protein